MTYRIPKGTPVFLVINSKDVSFTTEKTVHFENTDVIFSSLGEIHFHLPSNNRGANWMIVRRKDVQQ